MNARPRRTTPAWRSALGCTFVGVLGMIAAHATGRGLGLHTAGSPKLMNWAHSGSNKLELARLGIASLDGRHAQDNGDKTRRVMLPSSNYAHASDTAFR